MSLASGRELPGLASVLAEVEEPRQYKVEALGDWAYVYSREGCTVDLFFGIIATESHIATEPQF